MIDGTCLVVQTEVLNRRERKAAMALEDFSQHGVIQTPTERAIKTVACWELVVVTMRETKVVEMAGVVDMIMGRDLRIYPIVVTEDMHDKSVERRSCVLVPGLAQDVDHRIHDGEEFGLFVES